MNETETKLTQLRALMRQHDVDALRLSCAVNYAWLTGGGASHINIASDSGVAQLLVTHDAQWVLTDIIEADRLQREEAAGHGWKIVAEPWQGPREALTRLSRGQRLGADGPGHGLDLGAAIARLRWTLQPAEVARFRALGAAAGEAIAAAARSLTQGLHESEIAARLAAESYRRDLTPIVVLVAGDDRLQQFRHPLPKPVAVQRHAMLVLCARQHGLVASVTRFVHWGALSPEIAHAARAAATLDATLIAATRPGTSMQALWRTLTEAYAAQGYPDGWQKHHQGGLAGYEPREYLLTPSADAVVEANQVFAWNPSVPGAKSEDTVLITADGAEVLTASPDWPSWEIVVDGQTLVRPAVLELA